MEFRLLGPLEVVAGRRVLPLGGQTQRRILAVLVVRAGEVVPVDAIVEAVWADNPPATAAGLVRTYVWRLRKVFAAAADEPPPLITRPPGYVLQAAPEQVDALRFEQLVQRARQEAGAGNFAAVSTALEEALSLWRGAPLADISGLEPLRPAIARLEQMRLAVLEDRIEARLALGHHAEVVTELQALTAELPFRERIWGHLIVALYRTGRQADALTTYQTVRSILSEQLGIEPSPDLQALERDILQHAPDLKWEPQVTPQPPESRPVPETNGPLPLPPGLTDEAHVRHLVGRTGARARLHGVLEKARSGQFRGVFLAGPPGIGKTALVAAFAREAHAEGVTVLHGRADEGATLPFQSVREAFRHWVASAPTEDLGLLDDEQAAHLSRIVLSLSRRLNGTSPVQSLGSEQDRYVLLEAIARWVAVLATARPAVVVLDDLHWADQATLLVVRHLLRHPPEAGALLVAVYRDTELTGADGLAGILADTRGDRRVAHMELGGLADDEVADLLRTRAGLELSRSGRVFASQMNHRTGGNPLFIHETLRHLIERGDIVPASNQWGEEGLIGSSGVPGGVQDVIEQRLRRLPEPSRRVLSQAAVVGEQFDLPVLSRLATESQLAVVEALEPAETAGLVRQLSSYADRYAFSHALVREAILEGLPQGERIRTHWEAGRTIASLHASHPEPRLGEIAHHLAMGVSAGDRALAVSANVEAGGQALEALAFEDALTRFRTATELLETAADVEPELAYAAWSGLTHAAIAGGVWSDKLREGHLRSAAIAREQKWGRRLAQAAIGFSAFCARYGTQADIAVVQGLVDEALDALQRSGSAERVLLLSIKATYAVLSGRFDEARALSTLAEEIAGPSDDPMAQASAELAQGVVLFGGPNPAELGHLAERVLTFDGPLLARFFLYGNALFGLAVSCLQRGDRAAFEGARARVAALPETRDSSYLADFFRLWDIGLALSNGRFDQVEDMLPTVSFADDRSTWDGVVTFQVALAGIERGRHEALKAYLRQFLESTSEVIAVRTALALLDIETGDAVDAGRQLHALQQHARGWDAGSLGQSAALVYRYVPEVVVRLHDPELATDLLPTVTEYSGQLLVSYTAMTIHGAADRAIGQLLLVLGRCDEAVHHMEAALALEKSFGANALAARTTYWQARARLDRDGPGDHEAARRLLRQVSETAGRLRMAQLQQDARRLQAGDV